MRLVYICDWLPPNFGAVGQYSLIFARQRAEAGEDVLLAGLSSGHQSMVEEQVGTGRLRVLRLRAREYDKGRLVRRAWWTVRTDLRLVWRLFPELRRADEILFTGAPPYLVHLLVPLNALLRRRLTYRITDFHPECLMAAMDRVPLTLRLLHRWTIFLRRHVHRFEVLGEDQRQRLLDQGTPPERIVLKRDPSPIGVAAGTPALPVPEALRGMFVLLYSGNYGVAHEIETFVAGYRAHHREGSGRMGLWLNATGAGADEVEARLSAEELPVHRTHTVPLADLPRLLTTADAHLVTLRDAFVGYVLPSKIYACIESRRPVLFVGSERSDVHLLSSERVEPGAYYRVPVGDGAGVAAALEAMADDAGARRQEVS